MQQLIVHFNRKKQQYAGFFAALSQTVTKMSLQCQYEIDRQFDVLSTKVAGLNEENKQNEEIKNCILSLQNDRMKVFVNVVEQFCRVLVERTTEYVKKVGEINKEIRNGDLGKKERSGVNIQGIQKIEVVKEGNYIRKDSCERKRFEEFKIVRNHQGQSGNRMTLSANAYITAATPNTFVAHSQQHNVMKLSQDVCSNSPIIPVPRPSSQHTHTRVSIQSQSREYCDTLDRKIYEQATELLRRSQSKKYGSPKKRGRVEVREFQVGEEKKEGKSVYNQI